MIEIGAMILQNYIFFQKFERERIFLMMDKAKDDKVSLEEFKQFFQKMSASDRNTLTEFLFRIFDPNGMNHTTFHRIISD